MSLKQAIKSKNVKIGVVGLGYVGLPMAVTVAKKGFEVLGFDVSQHAIDHVNSGENYIGDVADEDLKAVVTAGKLSATSDYSRMKEVNVVLIAVPTTFKKVHSWSWKALPIQGLHVRSSYQNWKKPGLRSGKQSLLAFPLNG
jgi:UDP-N-acetyl-D-mannosaminuronate dehydrogenase